MISLKQSVSELDRLESLQRASMECYRVAVDATGRNAVEIDPATTREFREELRALAGEVGGAGSADELRRSRVTFLAALEDYSGKAGRYVSALREKVSATTRALAQVVESIRRGSEDERRMQLGLGQLHAIAQDPDIARICPELNRAVATVEESFSQIKKHNQLVVTQLRGEIDSLHEALDSAREEAARDPVSGVLNRNGLLSRIREEINRGRLFSLVFVWASNLEYVHRRYGSEVRDQTLARFGRRLVEMAGPDAGVGRWGEDRFAVLVSRPKPEAMWLTESFSQELPGPYAVEQGGRSREIRVRLKTGVIETPPGTAESKLLLGADKLLLALETVEAPSR